ncbi:MAG: hypothetical protein KIH64_011745 [Mycobacterium sp.]|nr:hypothetical protein [Mycobacterium sp.]
MSHLLVRHLVSVALAAVVLIGPPAANATPDDSSDPFIVCMTENGISTDLDARAAAPPAP